MIERRKIPRHHILCYSRLFDLQTGSPTGFLLDINRDGMMVLCDRPLHPGHVYRFRVELPEYIIQKPFLQLTAQCIWCHPDVDPNFSEAGFQLKDLAVDDSAIIDSINENYRLHERQELPQ